MTGIYVHVPFCARKCPYCAFYSGAYSAGRAEAFTEAVLRNIARYEGSGIQADTLYFGGGTPSLLSPGQTGRIVNAAEKAFALSSGSAEVTLECNPCTVTPEKLRALRAAGVNRLSVGFQSTDEEELRLLGRLHTAAQAEKCVLDAAEAGFENISCDLMIGLPGQTAEKLVRSLQTITALPVGHISAYILKAEPGTPFYRQEILASLPEEDAAAELYLETVRLCEEAGFAQYEISNFARPGFESRHNLKYWRCEEYIGIGPGAHSFFGGVRYACPEDTDSFISSEKQFAEITDRSPDPAEEYVMLGLRLREGIELAEALRRGLPEDRLPKMTALAQRLKGAGLCTFDGSRIALSARGMLVSNTIIAELLG